MMKIVDSREILMKDSYDVIVVGGGVAGISAAARYSGINLYKNLLTKVKTQNRKIFI